MTVLIIGAGEAGVHAATTLREHHYGGRIIITGDEPAEPYRRPPLSKGYLAEAAPVEPVLRSAEYFASHQIEVRSGIPVRRVNIHERTATLGDDAEIPWSHLVFATGARPRPLAVPGSALAGVTALRTLADARRLRGALPSARNVVVVGGGFIGLEVASAIHTAVNVTVLEAAPRLLGRSVSACTADRLLAHHRNSGIDVRLNACVSEVLGQNGSVCGVRTDRGETIPADIVVAGIGVTACDELAREAGLPTDDGVLVDSRLRAGRQDVYAVGDCCRFPTPEGQALRLESVQNATDQARHVAKAIASGGAAAYHAVPWFWSNQKGARLQIAGLTAGVDESVVVGSPAQMKFSVHCFQGDVLVGVESVNRPADHLAARRLLAEGRQVRRTELDLEACPAAS